jgi:hypothetical protein
VFPILFPIPDCGFGEKTIPIHDNQELDEGKIYRFKMVQAFAWKMSFQEKTGHFPGSMLIHFNPNRCFVKTGQVQGRLHGADALAFWMGKKCLNGFLSEVVHHKKVDFIQ